MRCAFVALAFIIVARWLRIRVGGRRSCVDVDVRTGWSEFQPEADRKTLIRLETAADRF